MTVYAFKAECLAGEKATLGFRGESGRTQVIIDATAWIEEFGEGGLLRLRHEPDEGEAYSPASQTVENGVLTWTIAASDTASVGSGRAEVWYTVNGVAVASAVFRTSVLWSITEPGTEIPTGIDDWLTRADEALATITGKADQSDLDAEIARATEAEGDLRDQIDEIIAGGGGGGGGAVLSVNGQTGHVVLTAADVEALPDSTRIPAKTSDLVNDSGYITNAGVTSFNGQTGAVSYSAPVSSVNGQTGAVTGLATSAEVSAAVSGKADKATTLAGYGIDNAYTKSQTDTALAGKQDKLTAGANITIVNNVISATGGQGGGAVDSVNGKTGVVVLDAEDVGALSDNTVIPTKVSDLINDEGFGTYSLPSGGIPVTDLASSVQTSLGKADTALQSAPVTSVNNKTGAVVLTASDVGAGTYSKPSGGIPSSDLAQSVQDSLDLADTAVQPAAIANMQTTGNLVTSVSSSSTDSQYPSAKCLFDLVGNIESLLAAI